MIIQVNCGRINFQIILSMSNKYRESFWLQPEKASLRSFEISVNKSEMEILGSDTKTFGREFLFAQDKFAHSDLLWKRLIAVMIFVSTVAILLILPM